MRSRFPALGFLVAAMSLHAGVDVDPLDATSELMALEQARESAVARRDLAALAQIYSEDFHGIAADGQVLNRDQLFERVKRGDRSVKYSIEDVNIRFLGSVALFTGARVGHAGKNRIAGAERFTHVFVRRGERWVCVAAQATSLPNP